MKFHNMQNENISKLKINEIYGNQIAKEKALNVDQPNMNRYKKK